MPNQIGDLVARVIQDQAARELRGYRHTIEYALHVVRNGWLPGEDEPGIQHHHVNLRRHLAEIGHPQDDSFLLRLGLTVPGTQRGIVPPLMVLDANRGGLSLRRQKEAAGQILRLREALAIGRRFVPNLSPDTQQALAELADLSGRRPAHDEAPSVNLFQELPSEGAEELAEHALQFLDSSEKSVTEMGTQLLKKLACFGQSPLSGQHLQALTERGVFWPPCVYRDGGDAAAHRLIACIEDTSYSHQVNHLLLSLAWTRSDAAHQAFRHWAGHPPAWAIGLHVPPEEYTHDAGWCLDEQGRRRDLISPTCLQLVPAEPPVLREVGCRIVIEDRCPSCGSCLGYLFDFSSIKAESFPGEFADAPRRVLCCFHCACHEPVFTRYHAVGRPEWISPVGPRDPASEGNPRSFVRKLDDSLFPAFACADPFGLEDASTFGGVPMWLQDAEYPRCPECARVMMFLAQHDNGPLGEEGLYYAFFCASCHVAAVSYQQT